MPKNFTEADVVREHIYANRADLINAPTTWQMAGLQETASGYGSRLNSGLKIQFNGRTYRIYVTCWSNAGSCWFKVRGRTIYVS